MNVHAALHRYQGRLALLHQAVGPGAAFADSPSDAAFGPANWLNLLKPIDGAKPVPLMIEGVNVEVAGREWY